jgi:hypothetical protein
MSKGERQRNKVKPVRHNGFDLSEKSRFQPSTTSPLFFNDDASICANTLAACVPPITASSALARQN